MRREVVESSGGNAGAMSIWVAPFDIDQNTDCNFEKCGWYFYCYGSVLCSGPPHNYRDKKVRAAARLRRVRPHRRHSGCRDGHSKG